MMRCFLPLIAVLGLASCGGGGGGGTTQGSTLTAPSVSGTSVSTSNGGGSGTTPVPQTAAQVQTSNNTMQALLNDARTASGAGNVSFDSRLHDAAQAHADDMIDNGFFSHTGSDGSNVGDRATRAGYNWNAIGENLGRGQQSEQEIMDGWMGSPGHRENNLNPNFEDFGLAQAGSGSERRWVLVLGREQ